MSTNLFGLGMQLTVMGFARKAEWVTPPETVAAPDTPGSGVPLNGAVRTYVLVAPREFGHARGGRITFPATPILVGTYTLSVHPAATPAPQLVAYDAAAGAPADLDELVRQFADAINNDVGNTTVTAQACSDDGLVSAPGSGTATNVLILGNNQRDYGMGVIHSGAGAPVLTADPLYASLFVWVKLGAAPLFTAPQGWISPGPRLQCPSKGFVQRVESAGVERMAVQVVQSKGHSRDVGVVLRVPTIRIGPAQSEVSSVLGQ